ncbi:MAG TPA: hypothetical protein VGH32_00730, partial [Pirellulales bacterium]
CGLLCIFSPLEVVALFAFGGLIGMLVSGLLWLRLRRAEPGKPRLQFGLRTMLILVTLLAADCGYLGWQARIVRERTATLAEIETSGGAYVSYKPVSLFSQSRFDIERAVGKIPHYDPTRYLPHFHKAPSVVRRLLGDEIVFDIWLPDTVTLSEVNQIEKHFPEAAVQRGEPTDKTGPSPSLKR